MSKTKVVKAKLAFLIPATFKERFANTQAYGSVTIPLVHVIADDRVRNISDSGYCFETNKPTVGQLLTPGDTESYTEYQYDKGLADLALSLWVSRNSDGKYSTELELRYENLSILKFDQLKRMQLVVAKIERKLAKLSEKRGHASDMGEVFSRYCEVLGVETVVQARDERGSSYDESSWKVVPASHGRSYLRGLVDSALVVFNNRKPLPENVVAVAA